MRVLVCPDSFGGTLSAPEAAAAIAQGLSDFNSEAELALKPLSDGGPGFVQCLHAALGGDLREAEVHAPDGSLVLATWLKVGNTAYVESAAAVGLQLVSSRDAMAATSYGLGDLLLAAATECDRVVVGLGGTAVSDAGAGLLAALAGIAFSIDEPLCQGAAGLLHVDRWPAAELPCEVVFATDVQVPLLGARGAARGFAAQKGATADQVLEIEQAHDRFAQLAPRTPKPAHVQLGAGAAGGIGFALFALGADCVPGVTTVFDLCGLSAAVEAADLVVTGEGKLDWQTMEGKVVDGVGTLAAKFAKPVVAIAGQVELTPRECQYLHVAAAYSVAELVGLEAAIARPAASLASAAARVARTWLR